MKKNRTYHPRGELVNGFEVEDHPLYRIWAAMCARCLNQESPQFKNYGGRGIQVCEDWKHFANFANDMFQTYSPGKTLDRIDNDLGYFPLNCAWRSRSDQCVNRRKFKTNTSGYTGVVKHGNTWIARLVQNERRGGYCS